MAIWQGISYFVSMPERQTDNQITTYTEQISKRFDITVTQASLLTNLILCGGNLSKAARQAGTARQIHYDCLEYSENYRAAYSAATKILGNEIMLKIADRALNGDPTLYNGEIVTDAEGNPVKKYSDILQIYASKALAGYTDQPKQSQQSTSKSGPTVNIYLPAAETQPIVEITNEADDNE